MRLHELRDNPGASRKKQRKARGPGSGRGKTAGRGIKGQKSRSGSLRIGFEGGQMPIYQRLPKRGFSRIKPYKLSVINLGLIQRAIENGKLNGSTIITEDSLKECGLVRKNSDCVKLLAKGELLQKINIEVWDTSKQALRKIIANGGTVTTTAIVLDDTKYRLKALDVVERERAATTKTQIEEGMRFESTVISENNSLQQPEVHVDIKICFEENAGQNSDHDREQMAAIKPNSLVAVFADGVVFKEDQSYFSEFEETDDEFVLKKRFTGIPVSRLLSTRVDIVYVHANQIVKRISDLVQLPDLRI